MDPKLLRTILQVELEKAFKEELDPIKKTLFEHGKILDEHSRKLDDITVELHRVHKLADITVDLVRGTYEKNKEEIDEIKDHFDLPKKPYFGDQP